MRSTKIVVVSAVSRLTAMPGGASLRTSPPTTVVQTKPPKELPNDHEREDKWVDRSVAAFWPSVFTFFMEGFAAYGASMHPTAAFSVEAALTVARRPHPCSASRTPIAAEHEHGPYLISESGNVVGLDRGSKIPVGQGR
jgi:hypothetical protein